MSGEPEPQTMKMVLHKLAQYAEQNGLSPEYVRQAFDIGEFTIERLKGQAE